MWPHGIKNTHQNKKYKERIHKYLMPFSPFSLLSLCLIHLDIVLTVSFLLLLPSV